VLLTSVADQCCQPIFPFFLTFIGECHRSTTALPDASLLVVSCFAPLSTYCVTPKIGEFLFLSSFSISPRSTTYAKEKEKKIIKKKKKKNIEGVHNWLKATKNVIQPTFGMKREMADDTDLTHTVVCL
jgi:hypothetical protein